MAKHAPHTRGWIDRLTRKLVQVGFLALCVYPLAPIIYRQVTLQPAPTLASWLLPWDPLLQAGNLLHGNWSVVVWGAPLLILALTWLLGRTFCGWVCPLGTLFDLARIPAVWQRRRRTPKAPGGNSSLRIYILIGVLVAAVFSVQALGILDPLVIVSRGATAFTWDLFALRQPAIRLYLSASILLLALLGLDLWRPRFWCRHLCPLGALFSLVARKSLLNRRVSDACNECGDCRRSCSMNAIPAEGHDTRYADCHLCLECAGVCPRNAISFGFGDLAGKTWQKLGRARDAAGQIRLTGRYVPSPSGPLASRVSRRNILQGAGGLAAAAAGLVIAPLTAQARGRTPLRPPGALPEERFVQACVVCQECVRACPTGALHPTFLEAGLAGMGTPQIVPLQGACGLVTNCSQLCAQVCPAGAIERIPRDRMRLGLAQVDHHLCLAWDQGVKCLVCVEACPTYAAIPYNGRVIVEPDKCVGCGACESACPIAGAAIHVRSV